MYDYLTAHGVEPGRLILEDQAQQYTISHRLQIRVAEWSVVQTGLMKISTEIASAAALVGEEKAVEYTAKAGFDAWDFSMFDMCKYDWSAGCFLPNDNPLASDNYLAFARRLRQIGLDNGILCNQSHAPFPSRGPIIPYLKRALECTAEAGGKICIIHPDNYLSAQENAEMYFDLLPFAKECGVKIATENMWGWDTEKDQSSFAACATSAAFSVKG